MAMINNKHITFSLVLLCLIVVSPMAKAQSGLFSIVNINGLLFCTVNGALGGTSAPPFPNAIVQLQCGSQNTVVVNSTTNNAGLFSISTNGIQLSLPAILSGCRLVVPTPVSTCNATLPSGNMLVSSSLNVVGSLVSGLLNMVAVIPSGFLSVT